MDDLLVKKRWVFRNGGRLQLTGNRGSIASQQLELLSIELERERLRDRGKVRCVVIDDAGYACLRGAYDYSGRGCST